MNKTGDELMKEAEESYNNADGYAAYRLAKQAFIKLKEELKECEKDRITSNNNNNLISALLADVTEVFFGSSCHGNIGGLEVPDTLSHNHAGWACSFGRGGYKSYFAFFKRVNKLRSRMKVNDWHKFLEVLKHFKEKDNQLKQIEEEAMGLIDYIRADGDFVKEDMIRTLKKIRKLTEGK